MPDSSLSPAVDPRPGARPSFGPLQDDNDGQCQAGDPKDATNRCQLPWDHRGVCELRRYDGHGSKVAEVRWEDR